MKKISIVVLFLSLFLSGCVALSPAGPKELESDGNVYKTGFYGSLIPHDFSFEGETIETDSIFLIGNLVLNKLKHDKFNLYQADIGPYTHGTIYCEEKDYENAYTYYNDPENYSYNCILGVQSEYTTPKTIEFSDVDTDKFDALLDFANKSTYEPFDKKHNSQIKTVDLPMPDDTKDIRMVFYKESHDGLFTSSKGNDYYIIKNSLYLVYQYDHGEDEKLIAVKVPDEINTYFVNYMTSYI